MKHLSYALFDDADHARAALDEVNGASKPEARCSAVMHERYLDDGLLSISATGAAAGAREGAALAGALGAIAGAVVAGPMGLVTGGVLGAAYGLTFGAIAGASGPDRNLAKLSKAIAEGKLLLVVEAPDVSCQERADSILRGNGGRVRHKAFFS